MEEKTTLTARPALVISLKSLMIFTGCKEAAAVFNLIRLRIIYLCGAKVVHPIGFDNKQYINITEFLIIKVPIKNICPNTQHKPSCIGIFYRCRFSGWIKISINKIGKYF